MSVKYLYIIAGNYNQFKNFTFQRYTYSTDNDIRPIYVSNAEVLIGVENPDGLCIGTWRERTDIDAIMQRLLLCCRTKEKIDRALQVYDMVKR